MEVGGRRAGGGSGLEGGGGGGNNPPIHPSNQSIKRMIADVLISSYIRAPYVL